MISQYIGWHNNNNNNDHNNEAFIIMIIIIMSTYFDWSLRILLIGTGEQVDWSIDLYGPAWFF